MHSLLHLLGSVVVLPYLALALFFIFIGQVARAKGMMALIDVLLNNVEWYLGWWFYVAPVLWICLILTGFIPHIQRVSSFCLCLIAVASFAVVVFLSSERLGIGEFIFLLPCVAVAATSAWLSFRAGASVPPAEAT